MTANPDINDLTRLRVLYRFRGPRDGRTGITPDGTVTPAIRWSLSSVMADSDAAMRLGKEDHARWRVGMGLDEPPAIVPHVMSWTDDCPARGPGLAHARMAGDPAGVCIHCTMRIR